MSEKKLSSTFDKYEGYANQAITRWKQQNDAIIMESLTMPRYTKTNQAINKARAVVGKYFIKAATGLHGSGDTTTTTQTDYHGYYGSSSMKSMWQMLFKFGVREWNHVFLPGYHPSASLDSSFIPSLGNIINSAASGFEAWRQQYHPNCSMKESEQACRMVWFAIMWAVLEGRKDFSATELDFIWNFAMLYPYVDNFLDSRDPVTVSFQRQFVDDLQKSLSKIEGPLPTFSYHSKHAELLESLDHVKLGAISQGSAADQEILNALKMLTIVEAHKNLTSLDDILFHSCMKGALAVLPVCIILGGFMTPHDYSRVFEYGLAFQLIDDMQDFDQDRIAMPKTVFTLNSGSTQMLNSTVVKTLNYLSSETFHDSMILYLIARVNDFRAKVNQVGGERVLPLEYLSSSDVSCH